MLLAASSRRAPSTPWMGIGEEEPPGRKEIALGVVAQCFREITPDRQSNYATVL